ncbi:MAG: hypothetical protein V7718_06770 [Porticoccus sp.]
MAKTGAERTELHRLKKEASELSTNYLNDATHATVADFIQALEASITAKYKMQWCKLDPVVAGRLYKELKNRSLEEPIVIHELLDAWKVVEAAE